MSLTTWVQIPQDAETFLLSPAILRCREGQSAPFKDKLVYLLVATASHLANAAGGGGYCSPPSPPPKLVGPSCLRDGGVASHRRVDYARACTGAHHRV